MQVQVALRSLPKESGIWIAEGLDRMSRTPFLGPQDPWTLLHVTSTYEDIRRTKVYQYRMPQSLQERILQEIASVDESELWCT
jgi:hypothetical protein